MSLNNRRSISIMLMAAAFGVGFVCWLQPAAAKPDAKKSHLDSIPTVYALVRLPKDEPLLPESKQAQSKSYGAMKRDEITLLKSRATLTKALRQDQVRALAIIKKQANSTEWLEKALEVDFPNDSDIIRVGLSGSSPEELAIVVNAVVNAYIENREHEAKDQAALRFVELEKSCETARERVLLGAKMLRQLSEAHKAAGTLEQPFPVQSLQDCSRELRRLRLERVGIQVKLARQSAEKDVVKESKHGTKQSLEDQLAILAAQEKLLTHEEKELRTTADQARPSFEVELLRQEIDVERQLHRRLLEEKARLEVEKHRPSVRIVVVQMAEADNGK